MPSRVMFACLALLLALGVGSASAQRSDSLPPEIATAFRRAYPHATILHVSRESRDRKIVYEIESRDGSTRRDLLYDLAGQTLEIEEILPADSVPAAVRRALERELTGATLVGAERVTRGAVVLYEVQARTDGRTQYLTYDPEGARTE